MENTEFPWTKAASGTLTLQIFQQEATKAVPDACADWAEKTLAFLRRLLGLASDFAFESVSLAGVISLQESSQPHRVTLT